MGRFFVDDYYGLKEEGKIRDQCYVLCFLFCVVDNGARLQEALEIPS